MLANLLQNSPILWVRLGLKDLPLVTLTSELQGEDQNGFPPLTAFFLLYLLSQLKPHFLLVRIAVRILKSEFIFLLRRCGHRDCRQIIT